MAEFRSWISSLSLWVSSCSWVLSCCILLMYSAVFCSVVALLTCADRQGFHVSCCKKLGTCWMFNYIYILQLCSNRRGSSHYSAACLHTVPLCLAESWALPQDYVKCQIPVWCWNAASALQKCEWFSWSLFAVDNKKKHMHVKRNLSSTCMKAPKQHLLPYLFPSLHVPRRMPVWTLGWASYLSGLVVAFGLDDMENELKHNTAVMYQLYVTCTE